MKLTRTVLALSLVVSGAGCLCARSYNKPLGQLDFSQKSAVLETPLVLPICAVPSLSLKFNNITIDPKKFCSNPEWDLVVRLDIKDKNGQTVISRRFDRTTMQFASWHSPATSVVLDLPSHFLDALKLMRKYSLRLVVDEPDSHLGMGQVMLGWVK